jgi:hypothetical protein
VRVPWSHVCAGDIISCTLNVTNGGGSGLNNVTVTSALATPAEGCARTLLGAEASYTCDVTQTVSGPEFNDWTSGTANITVAVSATATTAADAQVSGDASFTLDAAQSAPASPPESSTAPTASPSPSSEPTPEVSPSPSPDPVQPEPPVYVAAMTVALVDCSAPTAAGERAAVWLW